MTTANDLIKDNIRKLDAESLRLAMMHIVDHYGCTEKRAVGKTVQLYLTIQQGDNEDGE